VLESFLAPSPIPPDDIGESPTTTRHRRKDTLGGSVRCAVDDEEISVVKMRKHWLRPLIVLLALVLGALGCNLTNNDDSPTQGTTITPATGAPVITISSPGNGAEVVRGQEVLVQSSAQDTIGITRIELRVNGFIVNTVSSTSPSGDRQFAVIQPWTPSEAGPATLVVIAYRASIPSTPAQIVVNVRQSAAQVTATLLPPIGVTQPPPDDPTCRAFVEVNGLNFRTGPETNYPIIDVLTLGELAEITGRLGNNSWWQVRDGLNVGWISAAYTSETGDCSLIPIVLPPPSPTPRPATATPTDLPTGTPIPGSPTPVPTATEAIPDLVVSAITGPEVLALNASGTVGARYVVTIVNQGTGNSGQFSTSFRQPDGTTQQLPAIVVNLSPGQSVALEVDVLFTASDNYQLEATADSGSQVTELDDGNNVRTLNVVITTQPGS
jgi:uncharacterized protein YgiM (DUF1202 family)